MSSQLKGLAAEVGRTDSAGESAPANQETPETPSPVDTGREEDWGIAPTRSGLSRETKMGFAFVMVLLVVFGFVVYKKIEQGRAERGDLLASVEDPPPSPDSAKPDSKTSPQESSETPKTEQNLGQFSGSAPTPAPTALTPASWNEQSFDPNQQQVVNTQQPPSGPPSQSLDQFPVEQQDVQEFAPPVETAAQFPQDSQFQTTSTPVPQTTTVAGQPGPEPTEFAPQAATAAEAFTRSSIPGNEIPQTPVPENEFAQAPNPPEFGPPGDLNNQPVPQEIPVAGQVVENGNAGGNPFNSGGIPQQPEPVPSSAEFENEQFTSQSQPVPQEFAQPPAQEVVETPAAGNPFGEFAPPEQGQSEAVQPPPAGTSGDPFVPTEVAAEPQPVPSPGPESFAPPQVTEAVPSTPTETIPVENAPPGLPEQPAPGMEFAQPNPLPEQPTEPKQLPVAENSNFQDFQPSPPYEAGIGESTTTAQHPVNVAPTEVADNSFGPTPGSQGGNEFSPTSNITPASDSVEVYEVRPGDNYWKISKKQYGTVRYFSALARYNQKRIPDPKNMRPGMKVLTPTREVLEANNPDLFPKYAAKTADVSNVSHRADGPSGFYVDAQGRPMYRVGQNDTLGGIAQKHLGRFSRWTEIYQLNRNRLKNPDALTLGDLLILPSDASRVNMVRQASGVR